MYAHEETLFFFDMKRPRFPQRDEDAINRYLIEEKMTGRQLYNELMMKFLFKVSLLTEKGYPCMSTGPLLSTGLP